MGYGKQAIYPPSLIDSWLRYRIDKNESLAQVIAEVNKILGRKYDNHSFWQWRTGDRPPPALLINKIIKKELIELISWYFKEHGYSVDGVDFELLGNALLGDAKSETILRLLDLMGLDVTVLDCESIFNSFRIKC